MKTIEHPLSSNQQDLTSSAKWLVPAGCKVLGLLVFGISLTAFQSPARADRFYLVGVGRNAAGAWSVTVPMKSVEQCETAGLKLQAAGKNKKLTNQTDFVGYECVLGD